MSYKPKTMEEIGRETVDFVNEVYGEKRVVPIAQNELIAANNESKPKKYRKPPKKARQALYLQAVSYHKLHRKMMTILSREVDNLMVSSHKGLLSKEESLALVNYLKLEKKLLEFEDNLDENISDEELEKIAKKSTKSKS